MEAPKGTSYKRFHCGHSLVRRESHKKRVTHSGGFHFSHITDPGMEKMSLSFTADRLTPKSSQKRSPCVVEKVPSSALFN